MTASASQPPDGFLLPLGDLLLGTLRRELAAEELRRWPSYEQARARLVTPSFTADETRVPARHLKAGSDWPTIASSTRSATGDGMDASLLPQGR